MPSKILFFFGTLFTGLGAAGLLLLSVQPFVRAIRVVFFHSRDDLLYDSDRGKATLEKSYRFLKKFFVFFLITGLGCLGAGSWLKYASRGNDSLWPVSVDEAAADNDSMEYQQTQENNITGDYAAAYGNSYSYYVTVSEKTIYFNGQEIGGPEEFEEYLKTLDRGPAVFLVDDFAVSPAYHKVEELLAAYGMNYETESDENDAKD